MRLLSGVLVVIAIAGTAASADGATIADVTGVTITSGQPVQTGQLSRTGVVSSCAQPKATPPLSGLAGSFHYRLHTFRSSVTNPVCVTVTLNPACGGSNAIFSAAYAGTFDPASPRTAYAADLGSTASTPAGYSFNAAGEGPFGIVVHEPIQDAGCASYGLNLTSDRPWAISAPSVIGDPRLGETLTASDAIWAPAAPSVQRQWRRCDADGGNCVDIAAATGTTYTVANADIGSTLRFVNVATDGGGTSTSQSRSFEAYIPFQGPQVESLGTGDRIHAGTFARGAVDHCATPGAAPTTVVFPSTFYLFDSFPVTSLLNEPACLVVRAVPNCFPDGVSVEIYTPSSDPAAGITANHAAHSGEPPPGPVLTSWRLPAGGNAEATVSHGFNGGVTCASYNVTLGADAPFASARPAIAGTAAEGGTLTASDGVWSGSPVFGHLWLRCDGSGAACVPIGGATGASYTPTSADVGRRLRVRVTATQGRAVSSDSSASDVVAAGAAAGQAAAPGANPGQASNPGQALDRTAPKGTLRLASRNLRVALKRGRIPVVVTCDEQCTAVVQVQVTRKLAERLKLGKQIVIARARGAVKPGARKTLSEKLTKRARRALRGRSSLRVTLIATFTDAAGNAARLKKNAGLTRPR